MRAVGFILIVTAALKLYMVSGERELLRVADAFLPGFTIRQTMLLSAIIEIFSCIVVSGKRFTQREKSLCIIWFVSLAIFYRVGLYMVGFKGYCPCFGTFHEILGVSSWQLNLIAWGLLAYMLLIAVYSLLKEEKAQSKKDGATAEVDPQIG